VEKRNVLDTSGVVRSKSGIAGQLIALSACLSLKKRALLVQSNHTPALLA